MSGVNIYESSEVLFRKQLAAFIGSSGLQDSGKFLAITFQPITTTQKNALPNVKGAVVYDGTLNKLCQNTGAGWETVTST